MKAITYPDALQALIDELTRLPSIGSRGAERLALHLLHSKQGRANDLAQAILQASSNITACPQCGFFAEQGQTCRACSDPERDTLQLCVVEQATDVLPLERCGMYQGLYHCLGGKISPLDGIMPEDLHIEKLLERVATQEVQEVILALSSDVEGEATALYLARELKGLNCRVSRLAQGMPAGAGLGHTDAVTIMRALEGRLGL